MSNGDFISIDCALRNHPNDRLHREMALEVDAFYSGGDPRGAEIVFAVGSERHQRAAHFAEDWSSRVGERAPNTPLLIVPWPETALAYEQDLLSWAVQEHPETCFGQEVQKVIGKLTEMCVDNGLPDGIRDLERGPFVRFALSEYLFESRKDDKRAGRGTLCFSRHWFDWPSGTHDGPPLASALEGVREGFPAEDGFGTFVRYDRFLLQSWRMEHPDPSSPILSRDMKISESNAADLLFASDHARRIERS